MGTRGLTAVYVDGAYKIAQYGQWDHYPSGQGVTALAFLREMDESRFRDALSRCRWITEDEHKTLWRNAGVPEGVEWVTEEQSQRFNAMPEARMLTRNHGAKVLEIVYHTEDKEILLRDSIDFAGDSLFCEYAYVIDLDKRTFEVYKGFNKGGAVDPSERFASAPRAKDSPPEYGPVRLLRSYSLDALPERREFLDDLGVDSDD